ncbi:MAG TPA: radical SAM protein, partial [Myxococcota bacterium]|nr:radical SAM protein [Myxococcota bacterium]
MAEKSPRVMVVTYGCQMNVFDSRRMIQVLGHAGYVETDDPAAADVIIFNTCSVRDRPEKKVLGSLSRLLPLKEIKPVLFGVAGCVAQQHGQALLDRVPYLDFVIGPDNIADLPDVVTRATSGRRTSSATWMDPRSYDFIPLDADVEAGPVAFLTIIKGCDNFCSYCMVPYVRGREVSKPAGLVLDEVRGLVKAGISEVTLLGQNVNSWGRGLEGNPTFPDL